MKTLRLILGDQLSRTASALREIDPARDVVLMVEVHEETAYVRHHKQKIVLVLSAMRHFAESLRAEGLCVDYVRLDGEARCRRLNDQHHYPRKKRRGAPRKDTCVPERMRAG